MAISFDLTLRNNRLDQVATRIGSAGVLRIYSGTMPTNVGTALSGNTLLAELTCGSPFAAAASGGVLTANAITQDSSANNTGTATFFRIDQSGGTSVVQGTVNTTGADLNLNTTSIVSGGPVQVTSLTLTEGNLNS